MSSEFTVNLRFCRPDIGIDKQHADSKEQNSQEKPSNKGKEKYKQLELISLHHFLRGGKNLSLIRFWILR